MKNYPVFIGTISFSYNPNKAKTSKMWLYELESRKELTRQKKKLQIRLQRFPWLSGFYGTSGGRVRSFFLRRARRGWTCRVLRRPGGYCLSVADDSLCCCCWIGCSVGFFGGRRGRKKTKRGKKKTQKGQMETDDVVLMLAAEGAGQRCGTSDARSPPDSGMFQ